MTQQRLAALFARQSVKSAEGEFDASGFNLVGRDKTVHAVTVQPQSA